MSFAFGPRRIVDVCDYTSPGQMPLISLICRDGGRKRMRSLSHHPAAWQISASIHVIRRSLRGRLQRLSMYCVYNRSRHLHSLQFFDDARLFFLPKKDVLREALRRLIDWAIRQWRHCEFASVLPAGTNMYRGDMAKLSCCNDMLQKYLLVIKLTS